MHAGGGGLRRFHTPRVLRSHPLRRSITPAIVGVMPARPAHPQTPDLFTATAVPKTSLPEPQIAGPTPAIEPMSRPQSPVHLLPKNLPGALARLNDVEIDTLLAAVVAEAELRDRLPPSLLAKSRKVAPTLSKASAVHAAVYAGRGSTQDSTASLTQGQINAVRAAFKAGIKPSMIARQFGISQADVRKTLASHPPERKGRG
jgi:hypothetical protein